VRQAQSMQRTGGYRSVDIYLLKACLCRSSLHESGVTTLQCARAKVPSALCCPGSSTNPRNVAQRLSSELRWGCCLMKFHRPTCPTALHGLRNVDAGANLVEGPLSKSQSQLGPLFIQSKCLPGPYTISSCTFRSRLTVLLIPPEPETS
jgi:hypothetical protein